MKRILLVSLALLLSLSFVLCTPVNALAAAKTTTPKCKITVSYSAKMTKNNHVGNSWSTYAEVNEKTFKKGKSISFECLESDSFSIECTAVEGDKIPDYGSCTFKISVKDLKKGKNKVSDTATVTENRGRYSGNSATWKFTVTVTKKVL